MLVLVAASCSGGAGRGTPVAALATTIAAETSFRKLQSDWARATSDERIRLEAALAAHIESYRRDSTSRLAEALLAWISLEKGWFEDAKARARRVQVAVPAGSVTDLARVIEAAATRRQGRSEEAYALGLPLLSKLIDGFARTLLNEELVAAALDTRRYSEAIELMDVALREAPPEDQLATIHYVEATLRRAPPTELSRWLNRASTATASEGDLRKLVARRLSSVAIETRSHELAQELVTNAAPLLGENTDAVSALAVGAARPRVEPRTVGLLLSFRDNDTRRKGIELVNGVAFGLGLPSSTARLVTRDDHGGDGRVEEALTALAGEGASVIIAGSTEREAQLAMEFAEKNRIPVLLLTPPPPAPRSADSFAFEVGIAHSAVEAELLQALVSRGATQVSILSGQAHGSQAPLGARLQTCAELPPGWTVPATAGLVLRGPSDCAAAAIKGTAGTRVAAGFGVEPGSLPHGSFVASAGVLPVLLGDASAPALATWTSGHSGPPSWWTALGHDAAVLAWAGMGKLPLVGTTAEPNEVAARRMAVRAAVASAQADLWTTEARGFGGGRSLPRSVRVRELK